MDSPAYNYLVPKHMQRPITKYDSHEHSELKEVVKDVMKLNDSTSPTWLVKLSNEKQTYALNIKEESIALFASLSTLSDTGANAIFAQRKAHTNQNNIDAKIVTNDLRKLPDEFNLKVNSLARQQINHGNAYYPTGKGLTPGIYRFNMTINDDVYEFQFNIKKDANHANVLQDLANFINKAGVNVSAKCVEEDNKISLVIEARTTGVGIHGNMFALHDLGSNKGIVTYYNLNQVVQAPANAHFMINGEEKESQSNSFILNQALQINLHEASKEDVHISYLPDSDKILGGIRDMIRDYNGLINFTMDYTGKRGYLPKLVNELANVIGPHRSELEACGIQFDHIGRMELDEALAIQACNEGEMQVLMSGSSPFVENLLQKMNDIKLNPMEYVEKILVTYPNTERPGVTRSYVTSLYSGMLFNGYC